ncbi:MAG: transketolase [Candidatus Saganbacteria bacterium]|nr:transketolase [Candidatus Saganbacteria bacterium]
MNLKEIECKALVIRYLIIEMISRAASGHPGGSLSATDIIATLFFYKMRHKPNQPEWPERDRFVLSKGHAAPALYTTLAEAGYFPRSFLKNLRQVGSPLQGHPDMLSLPGIEMTTGSLGQGLSVSVGMALAARVDKLKYRVYCLIGDGESQEGQIWEAAMGAGHHKLDNLCVIMDHNKLQIDGKIEDIKTISPVADKWRAFNFHVIDKVDGHNIKALMTALDKAEKNRGKPTIIIADTVKGKGVSFMEHNNKFHGSPPCGDQIECALKELK